MLEGAPGVLAAGEGREALLGVPVARDTSCKTGKPQVHVFCKLCQT